MKNSKSILAGIIAVLIWAVIPVLVKEGVATTPIPFFLFMRFAFASLLLLSWFPGILNSINKVSPILWMALIVDLGANYYFQTVAMKSLPVSWYIVIFSLNPILSLFLLKIKFTKRLVVSIAVSIVGTVFFITQQSEAIVYGAYDIIALILGMLTWVVYTFLIKKFQKTYSDLQITTLTNFISLVAVIIIWGVTGFEFVVPNSTSLVSASLLGIGTVLAYAFYSYTMRWTPAFGIMSQYLEPVFGVAAGYMIYSESLSFSQIIGATTIVVAMSRISASDT